MVVISMNVNDTVDLAEPDDSGTQEDPEMKSKPNFEIHILKSSGKTLSFSCSYINPDAEEGGQEAGGETDKKEGENQDVWGTATITSNKGLFEPDFTVFETDTTKDSFFYRFYPARVDEPFFLLFFIPEDVFAIDEVTMFEGEDWNEKKYAVAGDILDGHLYDLFMTMLEVRDCC